MPDAQPGRTKIEGIDKNKAAIYHSVFDTPEGRKVMEDLISITGYFGETFVANDPYATAYNCGQRRIVNRILNFIGISHANDMAKAHYERQVNNE